MDRFQKEAEYIRTAIRRLHRQFEKNIQERAAGHGITLPQMRVIKEASMHNGITIGRLSENLQMTQSTVSGIVDRLTAKSLLEKHANPEDKRSVLIHPSPAVEAFLDRDVTAFVAEPAAAALSKLPEDDIETVRRGLAILEKAFLHKGVGEP